MFEVWISRKIKKNINGKAEKKDSGKSWVRDHPSGLKMGVYSDESPNEVFSSCRGAKSGSRYTPPVIQYTQMKIWLKI
jgi:hypothetical protein